jgi:hypothetical protein
MTSSDAYRVSREYADAVRNYMGSRDNMTPEQRDQAEADLVSRENKLRDLGVEV